MIFRRVHQQTICAHEPPGPGARKRKVAASLFLAILLVLPSIAGASTGEVVLRNADFVWSSSEEPPPAGADWRAVELPHVWSEGRPGERRQGWYRLELPPLAGAATGERLAVHLPRFIMNASVHVNGRWLGECGSFGEPLARCWNHPLYLELSDRELRPGANALYVRLAGHEPYARLEPIRFGPAASLAGSHRSQVRSQAGVARFAAAAGLILVLFMVALWVASRDPAYGSFAVGVVAWEVSSLNNFLVEVPLPFWLFEWIAHVSLDALAVSMAIFVHRFFAVRRPRTEAALLGFLLVAGAAIGGSIPGAFHHVTLATHAVSVGIALYTAAVIALGLRPLPARESAPWVALIVLALSMVGNDILAQAGVLGFTSPRYLSYLAPVLALCIGASLTVRFLREFARARNANVELEERVREKHAELETQFQRTRELEAARRVDEERVRIMREMHDGLGGQLVSTLSMVESGDRSPARIADALRASLDDMHLVIDSLDPMIDDVATLLGMIRGRIESRLERHGLRFDWDVADLPRIERLGSPELLHVLRIVQEALTNVLKHAEAEVVRVSTGTRENEGAGRGAFVEIRDDGVGLRRGAGGGHGRGLRNMRARAAEIGAKLTVESATPGTRLELWIPLEGEPRR